MKIDLDSNLALESHRRIIRSKGVLKKLYSDFYKIIASTDFPKGPIVELGSGAGFIKEVIPNAITSDIIASEEIDKVFSATKIHFPKKALADLSCLMFSIILKTQKRH